MCQRSPRCRVDFPALRPGNTMLTSCQGFQSWGKTRIYTLGHILAKYLYASIHVGFKCCWLFDLKPILPYHISRAHLVLMLLWGGFIPPHWWWNLKEQALKPRDITGYCLIYTGLHVFNDPKRNHQVIVINIGKRSQLCLISFIKKKNTYHALSGLFYLVAGPTVDIRNRKLHVNSGPGRLSELVGAKRKTPKGPLVLI